MILSEVKGNLECCLKEFESVCVESPELARQWPEIEEAFDIAIKAVDKQMEIADMINDMTQDGDDSNTDDYVSFASVFNILNEFYVFSEAQDE